MASTRKQRLYCLEPRKEGHHRVCMPYSDYEPKSRDFTLKALRTAAKATDGGTVSSCDSTQSKCYVIEHLWGSRERTLFGFAAIVAGLLVYKKASE